MKPEHAMGAAALLMASGVGIGALGSHALRDVLSARELASLGTAVDYQQVNALGLLLVGLLMRTLPAARLQRVAWLLVAGILCFSGGIYMMLAGAPDVLGLVTPLGGLLLIGAWLTLAWLLFKESVIKRPW
jgi:uncharacterized membrane protein YgdD (TMEM256/DUF423 family)